MVTVDDLKPDLKPVKQRVMAGDVGEFVGKNRFERGPAQAGKRREGQQDNGSPPAHGDRRFDGCHENMDLARNAERGRPAAHHFEQLRVRNRDGITAQP